VGLSLEELAFETSFSIRIGSNSVVVGATSQIGALGRMVDALTPELPYHTTALANVPADVLQTSGVFRALGFLSAL
jgi:hypothetical protein